MRDLATELAEINDPEMFSLMEGEHDFDYGDGENVICYGGPIVHWLNISAASIGAGDE